MQHRQTPADADRLASALVALARIVQATGYEFVTPTPATHARVNARPGAEWAAGLRDVLGWSRPFRTGAVPPPVMDAMKAAGVLAPYQDGWRCLVRLSTLDGLLFVHSAYPTEAADAVFFGPDTYRFAQAISGAMDRTVGRAVDIGCGAGPGAILIARDHRLASVFAVDINDHALALTRVNATLAGVSVEAVNSNLLTDLPGTFDLIVPTRPIWWTRLPAPIAMAAATLGAGLSLAILESGITRLAARGHAAALHRGRNRERARPVARRRRRPTCRFGPELELPRNGPRRVRRGTGGRRLRFG